LPDALFSILHECPGRRCKTSTRAALTLLLIGLLAAPEEPALRSGLDPSTFDRSVRPQDDLYRFVNGKWLDSAVIPAEHVTYGTFTELADQAEQDVRRIIERLDGRSGPGRQIRDLYASMMNEARVEALGDTPIREELARIEAIDSRTALARQIGRLSAMNAGGPFASSAGVDARNPGVLIVTVSQGGTLLPERDYYLSTDAATTTIREQYLRYLVTILTLVKRPDAEADARAILALETTLAQAQQPHAESRTRAPAKRFKLPQAEREMPGFEWKEWARPQGFDLATTIVFEQPGFFRVFAANANTASLDTWKAWLAARYITASSIFISRAFADARFEFFGRVLSGQEVPRDRWKRAVSMVNAYLGDEMGRLYVREHFPESSRRRVRGIVRTIVDAFRNAVDGADWMTPEAKRHARAKLQNLQSGVGYPDRWRRYDRLAVRPDDLLGNAQRAWQFENRYQMGRLRRPVEPSQWLMTPQTVNAYYTPSRNEIILPAAMLQPPLFDPAAEDAVNYGGIGALIGHEISHAFDQRGRRFDAFGRAKDWWTPKDEEQFQQRARRLVEQFNAYAPLPGRHVNGELTLVENVGDLSGLAVAIRAYRSSLAGKPGPTLDGFTAEQRLLLRWAQVWRGKTREEYVRQTLFLEQHAPPQYRAHGPLVNLEAFYEGFGVQPGDKLYLDPKKRVRIW
jgi:predicted metalloendopeptidase